MEIPFLVFAFLSGFIFSLPLVGYYFRFEIPISLFFFIAGIFMISLLLATDTLIMDYFSNGSTNNLVPYDVESSTGQVLVNAVTAHSRGERLSNTSSALFGDTIDCITLFIGRSGSPPLGTLIQIGIMDTSTNFIRVFGTMNVTQLLTSAVQPYEFCLPLGDTYTFTDTETFGVKYNAGDATNTLTMRIDNNNPFNGNNTEHVHATGSSWISNAGQDLMAVLTLRGSVGSIITAPYDISLSGPNYQVNTIMVFISVMYMVGGALIEVKSRR